MHRGEKEYQKTKNRAPVSPLVAQIQVVKCVSFCLSTYLPIYLYRTPERLFMWMKMISPQIQAAQCNPSKHTYILSHPKIKPNQTKNQLQQQQQQHTHTHVCTHTHAQKTTLGHIIMKFLKVSDKEKL